MTGAWIYCCGMHVHMLIMIVSIIYIREAALQMHNSWECTTLIENISTILGSCHTLLCPDCVCPATVHHFNPNTGQLKEYTVLRNPESEALIYINSLNDTGLYWCSCPCNRTDPLCYNVTVLPTDVILNGSTEVTLLQNFSATCISAGYPAPNLEIETSKSKDQCPYNLTYFKTNFYTRVVIITISNVKKSCHSNAIHCYAAEAQSAMGRIVLNVTDKLTSSSTVIPTSTNFTTNSFTSTSLTFSSLTSTSLSSTAMPPSTRTPMNISNSRTTTYSNVIFVCMLLSVCSVL